MSKVTLGVDGYRDHRIFIRASSLVHGAVFVSGLVCKYVAALEIQLHPGNKAGGSTFYAGIVHWFIFVTSTLKSVDV